MQSWSHQVTAISIIMIVNKIFNEGQLIGLGWGAVQQWLDWHCVCYLLLEWPLGWRSLTSCSLCPRLSLVQHTKLCWTGSFTTFKFYNLKGVVFMVACFSILKNWDSVDSRLAECQPCRSQSSLLGYPQDTLEAQIPWSYNVPPTLLPPSFSSFTEQHVPRPLPPINHCNTSNRTQQSFRIWKQ